MFSVIDVHEAADEKLYVEDVFSAFTYTGNGSTQSIVNGIDLAGKGGLVWTKQRGSTTDHFLIDSDRGGSVSLSSNTTAANNGVSWAWSFNSDGYNFSTSAGAINANAATYIGWTFRKAKKFFDVKTYTGNGVAGRQIAHDLGVAPGMIIVKRTDSARNWAVYHRSATANQYLLLNSTASSAADSGGVVWNSTEPTDSNITLGSNDLTNGNGSQYVAYIFAHDDSADGIIQCGTYTGNGSATGPNITLGWEPQYVLIKRADNTGSWAILDSSRGMTVSTASDPALLANQSSAESLSSDYISPTGNGFQVTYAGSDFNASGGTFVYLAIRKGLMRPPTDASKVFDIVARVGTGAAATITTPGIKIGVDLAIQKVRSLVDNNVWTDRLRGTTNLLYSNSTNASASSSNYVTSFNMDGVSIGSSATINQSGIGFINYFLKQARGFFDIVGYVGTGVARTVPHNLGAVPELMIVKNRSGTASWAVFYGDPLYYMLLDSTAARANAVAVWNNTAPTDSQFSVFPTAVVNNNAANYIAYLFASCPGVSKIGTYTGTGAAQNINCGFAAGARFVMIKRIDATDAWYYVDTVRGIVVGNDPFLMFNSTAAEATAAVAEPYAPGFTVSSALAVSGGTYLYFSVA